MINVYKKVSTVQLIKICAIKDSTSCAVEQYKDGEKHENVLHCSSLANSALLWHYYFGHSQKKIMETQINSPVVDSKLKSFFVEQLKDIYWAEKKLVKKTGEKLEAEEHKVENIKTHISQIEKSLEEIKNKINEKKICFEISRICHWSFDALAFFVDL